ncbi:hypothetical protein GCM10010964_16440 [Caldovatus sediminis]|uniref:TerB family tellurite resistance protein n=1 Tax=Caldovatus sediminis TaxID=2041189 RepID=A0A8J2ZAM0_9PROT|nr:hypothetical protein [Caldovatus sediminis]GGG29281.1 hypothetical protein GCM10010964_16440 [Caldovatus sediminis]
MSDEFLGDRKRALEEAFFAKENERLRQRLRQADETKARKQALAAASGISDEAVLERLVALDLGSDTLAALSLVPLVMVAWADGSIEEKEREAVLAAAAETAGTGGREVDCELLDRWLKQPPPRELVAAWTDYARAVSASLDDAARQALKAEVVGRARRVAEAAGGFLGLGRRVSAAERAVLERLEQVFSG